MDSWNYPSDRAVRPGFPPLQRAQIVRLACLEPIAKGLHITHWTSKDLARQAVEDGITTLVATPHITPRERYPGTSRLRP
jgi:hypothetical protein